MRRWSRWSRWARRRARRRVRLPRVRLPDAARRAAAGHRQSRDHGVHRAAARRGPRPGQELQPAPALGAVRPHLHPSEAGGDRRRGQRLLRARRARLRADPRVDRGQPRGRRRRCAAPAPSPSSSPRTSTSRRRATPCASCAKLLITRRLEAALSKRRILEIYLNSIEWGDGIFGCEAAARAYFSQGRGRPRARRGGAARRRDHQPARPQSGPPDPPAAAPPADHPAADGSAWNRRRTSRWPLRLRPRPGAPPRRAATRRAAAGQAARPTRRHRRARTRRDSAGTRQRHAPGADEAACASTRWSGARRAPRRGCSGRGRTLRRRARCRRARRPGAMVLKNTRSPARTSSRDTRSPAVNCSRVEARHRPAVLREHVADQPAAIEARPASCRRCGRGRRADSQRGGGDAVAERFAGREAALPARAPAPPAGDGPARRVRRPTRRPRSRRPGRRRRSARPQHRAKYRPERPAASAAGGAALNR